MLRSFDATTDDIEMLKAYMMVRGTERMRVRAKGARAPAWPDRIRIYGDEYVKQIRIRYLPFRSDV